MITLSHNQHLDDIAHRPMSQRERLAELDQRILDILYDDHLRQVAHAMWEEPPVEQKRSHMFGAIALNCMLWFGVLGVLYAVFRP